MPQTLLAGSLCGYLGMLGGAGGSIARAGRPADLVAETDAEVLVLARAQYERLCMDQPAAALLLTTAALVRSAAEYNHHCTLVARTMFASEPRAPQVG